MTVHWPPFSPLIYLFKARRYIPEQANAGLNENTDEASIQRKKLVSARLVRPGLHAYSESRWLMHGA